MKNVKLYTGEERAQNSLELKLRPTGLRSEARGWMYHSAFSEEDVKYHLPRIQAYICVDDRLVFLYSAVEHSRGGSLLRHKIEILDSEGSLKHTVQAECAQQFIAEFTGGGLQQIFLLRYKNGSHTYNNALYNGKPALELLPLNLYNYSFGESIDIELPRHLRGVYCSGNISMVRGSIVNSGKGFSVRQQAFLTAKGSSALREMDLKSADFTFQLPL